MNTYIECLQPVGTLRGIDQLEKDLQAHFETSWKTLLTRQVGPTRQILRKLLNGDRLPFIPMTNESGSHYEFQGIASVGRLLTGGAKAPQRD